MLREAFTQPLTFKLALQSGCSIYPVRMFLEEIFTKWPRTYSKALSCIFANNGEEGVHCVRCQGPRPGQQPLEQLLDELGSEPPSPHQLTLHRPHAGVSGLGGGLGLEVISDIVALVRVQLVRRARPHLRVGIGRLITVTPWGTIITISGRVVSL